jgi:hypothetical protein
MKIARYQHEGKECYGIMQPKSLLYLPALAKRLKTDLPSEIEAFIIDQTAHKRAEALLSKAKSSDLDAVSTPLNEATLMAQSLRHQKFSA